MKMQFMGLRKKVEKVVTEEESQKSNKQATDKGKVVVNHPPVEHRAYPHAPSKNDKQRQFMRFLDIFKRLQINIHFSEALEQMPTYAKFMKEFLTKNRRIMDNEKVEAIGSPLLSNCRKPEP